MAVGDLVTAARFNNLQSRVATILGNGVGSDGYGQDLNSNQVLSSATVTATDMSSLYLDMVNCRAHQVGAVPDEISSIVSGDTILDDDTAPFDSKSFAAFEDLMLDIEADRFLLHPSQALLTTGITSTRTTSWNGTLIHEFSVTFNDFDHRRHYFNSGGEIRFSSTITGGTEAKTNDWRVILGNAGTVKFNYNTTESTGSGSGTSIGNFDLIDAYQTLFTKVGSDENAAYSDNSFAIYGKTIGGVNSKTIQFKVEYVDNDSGDPPIVPVPPGAAPDGIDEDVDGIIKSTVQQYRAHRQYVSVDAPNFFNVIALG